jgi:hypothetical protein
MREVDLPIRPSIDTEERPWLDVLAKEVVRGTQQADDHEGIAEGSAEARKHRNGQVNRVFDRS